MRRILGRIPIEDLFDHSEECQLTLFWFDFRHDLGILSNIPL